MTYTPTYLQARYGAKAATWPVPRHPVLEHILSHRSVRNFLPDALPPDTVQTLVAAAQSAPSSSNLQTWSVVAVHSQDSRNRLAELAGNQAHIRTAPLLLVWLADLSRIARIAQYKDQPADGLPYLDTYLMAVIDAALAAQNAVVAAEALGLGTVYIGALRNQPEAVAQVVGTPEGVFPVFGLVVGHPDPARPAAIKPRLPQAGACLRHFWGREGPCRRASLGARRSVCPCTRKKRNDEWRAGKDLPFGLSGLGAACGVARACKAPALLRTRALHPASRPGNAIPKNGVDRPLLHHERYTAPPTSPPRSATTTPSCATSRPAKACRKSIGASWCCSACAMRIRSRGGIGW